MVRETDVIKKIKTILSEGLMEGRYWQADEVLSMAAVYIYPLLDSVSFNQNEDISRFGTLKPIYDSVKKWSRHKKLSEYTKKGLYECFKNEWTISLSAIEKETLLKKGITLISGVEEGGFLSFNGNRKVYETIIKIGAQPLHIEYGNIDYVPAKEVVETQAAGELLTRTVNWREGAEAEECLKNVWSSIIGIPSYREKMPMVWKLRIPFNLYTRLKESLNAYLSVTPDKKSTILEKHAEKFLVYVALWFRWEYNGQQEKENALTAICQGRFGIQDIWDYCPEKYGKFLHKSENDINLWLYSTYTLGGLPLRYIYDSGRFDGLFKTIYSIPEVTEETLAIVASSFDENNAAYTQSFKSGSFKEYVKSLLDDEDTIADEDRKAHSDLVACYDQLIKNGHKEKENKVFSHEWLYYVDTDARNIECCFRLKIGYNNQSMYIAAPKCIDSQSTDFFIGIETKNGRVLQRKIRFCRISDNAFMGWGNSNVLEFDMSAFVSNEVYICIYTGEEGENRIIAETIKTPECIQLYSTKNPYEWSDRKNGESQSSLLYLKTKYQLTIPDDSQPLDFTIGPDTLCWHFMTDCTEVKELSTGNIKKFLISRGHLGLSYELCPYIRYEGTKGHETVKFINDGIACYLPLIVGRNGVRKVTMYPFEENKATMSYNPKDKQVTVTYKQVGCYNYKDFYGSESPKNGRLRLKVSLASKATLMIDCFYIESEDFLKLDVVNNRIKFSDCCKTILVPAGNQIDNAKIDVDGIDMLFETLRGEELSKRFYYDRNFDRSADVIPVLVPSDEGYLCIDVWRPRQSKELHFENHWLTTLESNRLFDIPLILKDCFNVRVLNPDAGVKKYGTEHKRIEGTYYIDSLLDPRSKSQAISVDDYNLIKVYKYKTDKWISTNEFEVSENYADKYHFYYWNYKESGSRPQRLNTTFTKSDEVQKYGLMRIDLPSTEEGIVFQSLKDANAPHYLSPIYLSNDSWNALINYKLWFGNAYLSIYRVAVEHKVYFAQFPPMARLGNSSIDALIAFVNSISSANGNNFEKNDIKNLNRFAQEFAFDWLLIPKSAWARYSKTEHKICLERLFKESPLAKDSNEKYYLKKFIEEFYWRLRLRPNTKLKGNSTAKKLLNYILGKNNISTANRNEDLFHTRKNDLEAFESEPRLFEKIIEIIENNQNNLL